jgi:enolase-phosphatase E1
VPLPDDVHAILVDIEGTTTPLSFVYDVLFPYAQEHLDVYCAVPGAHPGTAEAVDRLRHEWEEECGRAASPVPAFDNGGPYAHYLMEQDRKSTGLKMLQGIIWEQGYRSGALRSAVFADVPPALRAWRAHDVRLRVFSSGSVLAQKLLFRHTDHGDLTGYFEGYHDTTTGPKKEAGAYAAIADAFGLAPGVILFLSDVTDEIDAASEAGLLTRLVIRPGNTPTSPGPRATCRTFDELVG